MSFPPVPCCLPLFRKDWGSDVPCTGARGLGHLTVPHRSCLKNTKVSKNILKDFSHNGHMITTRGNKREKVGGLQVQKVGHGGGN